MTIYELNWRKYYVNPLKSVSQANGPEWRIDYVSIKAKLSSSFVKAPRCYKAGRHWGHYPSMDD